MFLGILKIFAAVATALTGLYAMLRPTAIDGFTGIAVAGNPRGIVEVRSIFGGLFIAVGLAPFIFGADAQVAYRVLGLMYAGIGLVRIVAMVIDKSFVQSNWVSLGVEIVLAAILLWPVKG